MPDNQHFKRLLLNQQSELQALSEMGDEASKPVELDQTRVGRLSRMDALQGQAMSLESRRRRELELVRIAKALKRFELGEYGECQNCGEEIASGRLEIDPSAALCIRCAETGSS